MKREAMGGWGQQEVMQLRVIKSNSDGTCPLLGWERRGRKATDWEEQ